MAALNLATAAVLRVHQYTSLSRFICHEFFAKTDSQQLTANDQTRLPPIRN